MAALLHEVVFEDADHVVVAELARADKRGLVSDLQALNRLLLRIMRRIVAITDALGIHAVGAETRDECVVFFDARLYDIRPLIVRRRALRAFIERLILGKMRGDKCGDDFLW